MTRNVHACEGFVWIGQTFTTCDHCGWPYWEHSHDRQFDPGKGLGVPDPVKLVPISPEDAAACKAKWGRGL